MPRAIKDLQYIKNAWEDLQYRQHMLRKKKTQEAIQRQKTNDQIMELRNEIKELKERNDALEKELSLRNDTLELNELSHWKDRAIYFESEAICRESISSDEKTAYDVETDAYGDELYPPEVKRYICDLYSFVDAQNIHSVIEIVENLLRITDNIPARRTIIEWCGLYPAVFHSDFNEEDLCNNRDGSTSKEIPFQVLKGIAIKINEAFNEIYNIKNALYGNITENQKTVNQVSNHMHDAIDNEMYQKIMSNAATYIDLQQKRNIKEEHMYLMAEHCDSAWTQTAFPSLDYSDDEEDDIDGPDYMDNTGGVYLSQLNHPNNKYHVDVYELEDARTKSIHNGDWIVKFAGLSSAKDVILPYSIHKKVIDEYTIKHGELNKHMMREYNVLFRVCGSAKAGWSESCNAVIIDETYLNHGRITNGLFGFNWRLPELPIKTGGNGVTFSDKYGLISVGGYKSNQCHVLSFNSEAYFQQNYDWYWKELATMNEIRWFPSCCMMTDNKLIAISGSSADHEPLATMECFDFTRNEWQYLSSCNNARKYGGLYHIGNKLYIGGGDHATQSVEYYDIHQNKWYNLPSTQIPHKYYPNLWKQKQDPNMLYISCSYSNSVERIDLRAHDRSWNVICAAKLFQTDALDLDYNQFRSVL